MGFEINGEDVAYSVKNLAVLTDRPEILEGIDQMATSCDAWGTVLKDLMKQHSIKTLHVEKFQESMSSAIFQDIEQELRKGKAVISRMKTPATDPHIFTIDSDGLNARILHAWQDVHLFRAEKTMAIANMMELLKKLTTCDWVTQRNDLLTTFQQLFGEDNAMTLSKAKSFLRNRFSFSNIISGRPQKPLFQNVKLAGLLEEMSYSTARSSRSCSSRSSSIAEEMSYTTARSSRSCSSRSSSIADSVTPSSSRNVGGMIRMGTAAGGALGFVFGLGGVLISGERDPKEVVLAGTKSALGGAAGGGAGAAAAKLLKPTFSRIGSSVVRANIVSGVAFAGVFAIWDVVEWRMHRITEVQMRQRMAESLAGAAGGIGVGAAAGVGFGLWLGPVGALGGAIIGGIAGGIGGSYAGKAIDEAIWDKSEDSIMNSYEFFGWHGVQRNTRPVKSAGQWHEAYDNKLKSKPSNMKEKDWDTICRGHLMVLLPAMYPAFPRVMKIGDYLQKNRSDALSAIATMIYQPEE